MAGAASPDVDRHLTSHTAGFSAALPPVGPVAAQLQQPSFKAVNLDDEDDEEVETVETKAEPETGSEPLQSEARPLESLEWTHSALVP